MCTFILAQRNNQKQEENVTRKFSLRKNWLNILAVCSILLGVSTTIYFLIYANNSDTTPQPILFGKNYDDSTCKYL